LLPVTRRRKLLPVAGWWWLTVAGLRRLLPVARRGRLLAVTRRWWRLLSVPRLRRLAVLGLSVLGLAVLGLAVAGRLTVRRWLCRTGGLRGTGGLAGRGLAGRLPVRGPLGPGRPPVGGRIRLAAARLLRLVVRGRAVGHLRSQGNPVAAIRCAGPAAAPSRVNTSTKVAARPAKRCYELAYSG
jgi:hypothetical protein